MSLSATKSTMESTWSSMDETSPSPLDSHDRSMSGSHASTSSSSDSQDSASSALSTPVQDVVGSGPAGSQGASSPSSSFSQSSTGTQQYLHCCCLLCRVLAVSLKKSFAQPRCKVYERCTTNSQCQRAFDVSLSKLCMCKVTVFNLEPVALNLLPPLHPPASLAFPISQCVVLHRYHHDTRVDLPWLCRQRRCQQQ